MNLPVLRELHKYQKTAEMAAAEYTGDSPLFLVGYLLRFLRVAVLLAVWHTILAGQGGAAGMTMATVLTYTLISEVFAEQLACITELPQALWAGTIATRFLHPLGIFSQFAAETFGRWAFTFATFSLPLLLLAPMLGIDPRPAGLFAGLCFVLSLALAISVGLAVEYIFGSLMIHLNQSIYTSYRVRIVVTTLLSGSLLPLVLLPWGLGEVFAWLPFAAMASAPLRIYTGTGEALPLIAGQLLWSLLLWPLALRLWQANRERLVSYGG